MNEKLEKFLAKKKEAELEKVNKEKNDMLLEMGLYDKVYSPDNAYNNEYDMYEWDNENNMQKYYKIVPIEITDEEYQEIKKYQTKEQLNKKNTIASALVAIAWSVLICGFNAGISRGNIGMYNEVYDRIETEFSFSVACGYWGASVISFTMFLGFAEIIKLLEDIKRKLYKS